MAVRKHFTNLSAVQTNKPCRELAAQCIERETIMAINYAKLFNRRATAQSQPIPGSN